MKFTYEHRQWAAVRTYFELSMVPPQKCPPFLLMLTIQGNSCGIAFCPPTSLAVRMPIFPWPQGTSATVIASIAFFSLTSDKKRLQLIAKKKKKKKKEKPRNDKCIL